MSVTINKQLGRFWTLIGESETGFVVDVDGAAQLAITEEGAPVVAFGHPIAVGASRITGPGRLYGRSTRPVMVAATPSVSGDLGELHPAITFIMDNWEDLSPIFEWLPTHEDLLERLGELANLYDSETQALGVDENDFVKIIPLEAK